MQCTRCFTHMQLVKRENHQDSFLEWHQCPLCRRMEFTAQPIRHELELSGGTPADTASHPIVHH